MSNPKQDAALGEATRGGTTDDDEEQEIMKQLQMPGAME
jgi:hypothetical protein